MANGKSEKVLRHTTIKVRLHPTSEQALLLDKTFGCCRYLWNQMLADEQEFYAATGTHFIPTPAKYKAEAPFLKEVYSGALATVHQDLRLAFQRFFDKPEIYHHPLYKKKKDGKGSFTIYRSTQCANLYVTENGIRLPKIGIVKATLYRKPLHWWDLRSATVSKSTTGKYWCSLLYEFAEKSPTPVLPTKESTLGLNYSISHFYVDSNGHQADPPHWLGRSQKKLARLQNELSRMQRGSNHYNKQIQKIRLLHEHIANQRKDYIHQESRRIANACDAVCVRDSDLRAMSQTMKIGNVMDSGFGMFRTCLAYKLERQGKAYILVDKAACTAKTCHLCGQVNDNLTLADRVWKCPSCGAVRKRSGNAAENIRDIGLAQFYQAHPDFQTKQPA